ncbi:hypothetical protein EQZ23_11170 [Sphingomonas sp. UV9]|uniref:hypothetical protein n=1 Tax=Sphingomonas sp. UV9 TaxID=1851410 RepID=UPI000FFC2784|nr:hypothetical protein [Sphingomonas sp. UV9]RXD05606.1 hypothetical protein EQZ23_11170 [Sphingomonas sp. UV9]
MITQPRYGATLDREAYEDFGASIMAGCLTWIHFGDLHVDEADGYEGLSRFRALAVVAQARMIAGMTRMARRLRMSEA